MRLSKPSVSVFFHTLEDGGSHEEFIERVGRVCYKSEERITEESASKFVRMVCDRGHHAILEFGYATAKITADRGLTHELVRHRLASYAQESTRFCNYSKGKFGGEITVIEQPGLEGEALEIWKKGMADAEKTYLSLLKQNVPPQIARSVLPIGLKAEIFISANFREWMHIFALRCATSAHPIIRGVMCDALRVFDQRIPSIFGKLASQYLEKPTEV